MTGAERSARLIQQLLALARVEAEGDVKDEVKDEEGGERGTNGRPTFERINLNALVCEVAADFVPQALDRNIDLGVELNSHHVNSEMSLWLNASPVLLCELISNLIDNAIKYTPPDGRVTVATQYNVQQIELTVCDSGPGVPHAERERVFERFYRVLGDDIEGSGLGLPIVREVAELHGGQVFLQDTKNGKGICACVIFPIKESRIVQ